MLVKANAQLFSEIAVEMNDWMTIEEIVKLCDDRGFWSEDFYESVLEKRKKEEVRRLAGSLREDALGNPIELISIIQRDDKSGQESRVYKQLDLFDIGDFVQVITDRFNRIKHFEAEIKRFVRLGTEKFGNRLQSLLPFID